MSVLRYDRGRLARAGLTPVGGARVRALVSRTGVQTYRLPDGSTRREYRPAEEVFAADALASFVGAPVTIGHPRRVDPASFKRLTEGFVVQAPERTVENDGHEYVATSVDVNSADAITKVDAGDLSELSCGYRCDYDPTPGVAPNGEKYDGVQRNIRINHIAMLGEGQARAGRRAKFLTDQSDSGDELRLDSEGNQLIGPGPTQEVQMKFVLGGKEFEAGPELQAAIGALEAQNQSNKDKADAAQGRADAEKTRADKERERADKAEAAVKPEAIGALVSDELEFRASVLPVLGKDYAFKGKSRRDVKCAVIEKLGGKAVPAEKSDAYVDGRFDAEFEELAKADKGEGGSGGKGGEDYSKASKSDRNDGEPEWVNDDAAWERRLNGFHGKAFNDKDGE